MSVTSPCFNLIHSAVTSTPDAFPSKLEVRASGCFTWPSSESRSSFKVVAFHYSSNVSCRIPLKCFSSEAAAKDSKVFDTDFESRIGGDGGFGGDGNGFGGSGGGDGGDGNGDGEEEREFGRILKFDDVIKEADARGVRLPEDMLEAAKATGIREVFLQRYLDLQVQSISQVRESK